MCSFCINIYVYHTIALPLLSISSPCLSYTSQSFIPTLDLCTACSQFPYLLPHPTPSIWNSHHLLPSLIHSTYIPITRAPHNFTFTRIHYQFPYFAFIYPGIHLPVYTTFPVNSILYSTKIQAQYFPQINVVYLNSFPIRSHNVVTCLSSTPLQVQLSYHFKIIYMKNII